MPGFSNKRKTLVLDVLIVCLVFCLMMASLTMETLQTFNWKLFDALMNIHRHEAVQSEDIVIIAIDQLSLELYRDNDINWQWPRDFYERIVGYLDDCGAKAIIFDMIFSDTESELLNAASDNDESFGEAIRESGIVYLAVQAYQDTLPENPHKESFYLNNGVMFSQFNVKSYINGVFPIEILSRGARGLGLVGIDPEVDDIHRRYPLVKKIRGKYVPSLGFAVARDIIGEDVITKQIFNSSGKSKILDDDGELLLNWYGKGGVKDGVFPYYSYHGVMESSLNYDIGEPLTIPREAFKDKIVLIGSNAPALFDLRPTPFTYFEPYPGVEIHATAIQNFLNDDFIQRAPMWVVVVLMAVSSVIIFLAFKYLPKIRLFVAVFAACILLELYASYVLLAANFWLPWVNIFVTTTLSFAGLVLSGYFRESKDKKILRRSFERYVNDSVLEEILEKPDSVDFSGRVLTATIMATDIAGFTSISEKLSAHDVVSRLNDYLSEVSEAVIDNGGYINKYIGDAILAVFGAFGATEHHKKACIAGLSAMKIIERKIAEAKVQNLDPFVTRMGITTGDMTMGNIGSARKVEYTVIGDSVNSAFRLEGLNKYYNTRLLISEYTKDGAGDDFEYRLVDLVKVKGKETPVGIYELLGMKGDVDPEMLRKRNEFEDALNYYRDGKFDRALEKFTLLTGEGDPPSPVMKERCEHFIKNPPSGEWKGVWKMESK